MLKNRLIASLLALTAAGFGWQMNELGVENKTQTLAASFASGDRPSTDYTPTLAQVVELLERNPSYQVLIEGHAGTRGPDAANFAVSEKRSERAANDLRRLGIKTDRMVVAAAGETQPLAQLDGENDTTYQRRLGRVEFVIFHQAIDPEVLK
jgi:outer membrane protein OmpA-like peptidoglycan-associated protein